MSRKVNEKEVESFEVRVLQESESLNTKGWYYGKAECATIVDDRNERTRIGRYVDG